MKEEEADGLRAKRLEPVEHIVARDAIAVIVNTQQPGAELLQAGLRYLQREDQQLD
jgi:ABC-type phosphate transport system substrate-binding protein